MNPLERKKMLKEQFLKKRQKRVAFGKETISFKDLDIQIEPETFEWYRSINGGAKE